MWNRITEIWCRAMHERAMWPMHGKYTCRECFREYPVEWEGLRVRDQEHIPDASVSIDVCV